MNRVFPLMATLALVLITADHAEAGVVTLATSPGNGTLPPVGVDPLYAFTYSDTAGDAGFGTLTTTHPSGIDSLSDWAMTGTLTVTSSSNGNTAVGTYYLLSGGPSTTYTPSNLFYFDNLVYPNNDAGNGAQAGFGAVNSYLTEGGLVFGPVTGNQNEINIFGNGGGDYAFLSEVGGSYNIMATTGGTFTLTAVAEPSALALTGIAAIAWVTFWRRRWLANM